MGSKKNRFKPSFKKLLKLRNNIQNNKKIFNFNRKKWERFTFFYKLKLRWYNKYKPLDQQRYTVVRYAHRRNSYKQSYKNTLVSAQKLKYFYGGLLKTYFKNKINNTNSLYKKQNKQKLSKNFLLIKQLEYRLDTVLYRSKFCLTIRQARQMISHGYVKVNRKKVAVNSYVLKSGDLVTVDLKSNALIKQNGHQLAKRLQTWPLPPKHLYINYKTLQIKVGTIDSVNIAHYFNFHLELEKILLDYPKQ